MFPGAKCAEIRPPRIYWLNAEFDGNVPPSGIKRFIELCLSRAAISASANLQALILYCSDSLNVCSIIIVIIDSGYSSLCV